MGRSNHIVIVGNLGTGKTSLSRHLAASISGAQIHEEIKGRYVEKFYDNPNFAFLNQLDYMIQCIGRICIVDRSSPLIVEDRGIYDTHEVFSAMQFQAGNISNDEWNSLSELYGAAKALSPVPDYLVFLHASPEVSFERVARRGDKEEARVTLQYLRELGAAYETWFEGFRSFEKIWLSTEHSDVEETASALVEKLRS